MLADGTPSLRLSKVGYGATEIDVGTVAARETVSLPDVVALSARPGRIQGRVRLIQFETISRLRSVDVHLYGEGAEPIATTQPDADGRFIFDEVTIGEWRIEASHPAYEPRSHWALMEPAARVDAGELALNHVSTTARAVSFGGRVRLHRIRHGGTTIRILAEPEGIQVGTAVTRGDGTFRYLWLVKNATASISIERVMF